jgi:hypothetical protein
VRTSVDPKDRGYHPDAIRGRWQPFLNGEPVPKVITADEENGFVLAYALDANGKWILNRSSRSLERRVLHGRVEIRERPEWQHARK